MDSASSTSSSSSAAVPGGTSFVVLSVSIVGILAFALLLLSYYLFLTGCGLLFFWRPGHRHRLHTDVFEASPAAHDRRRGLQAAAIRRIPTFRYRQEEQVEDKGSKRDCAVCLADFSDGERLRLLPPCRHAFHIDCIDAWLQATANCPLCRATVVDPHPSAPALTGYCRENDIVIDISVSSRESSPPSPPAEQEQEPITTSRRSVSMDSSTVYLALQRMLHQQHQDQQQQREVDASKSPAASRSRSLRRSFFSFGHSRSATILRAISSCLSEADS